MKQRVDKISVDKNLIKCLIIEDFNPYTTFIGLTNQGLKEISYITICDVLKSGIDINIYNENGNFILDKMDQDTFDLLSSYDKKKMKMAEDLISNWVKTIPLQQIKVGTEYEC